MTVIKTEEVTVVMTHEDAVYRAFRLHGLDKLKNQSRKTLTRLAGALIEEEEHVEYMAKDDQLDQDAKNEFMEQLAWIDVVYKAIDKLLTDGETTI